MRNLFARIFLSFWLIILITIIVAGISGYYYSNRIDEHITNFEVSDTVIEAGVILENQGLSGLRSWLGKTQSATPIRIFIIDRGGRDILGRQLPQDIDRWIKRFISFPPPRMDRRNRIARQRNLMPARPLTQLVGPDNQIYTMIVLPEPPTYEWMLKQSRSLIILLTLLVSISISYLLSRAIIQPVRQFRKATIAISQGDLDSHLGDTIGKRQDEIGKLARDLDEMAKKIQEASDQQIELSRNISHELRSPLARMRVALELAQRKTGETYELSRIESESKKLDKLIGQILSYSKLKGEIEENKKKIDLAALMHEIVDNVNFECKSTGIDDVEVIFQKNAQPVIHGFTFAITGAIENIIRNAVHHSPKKSVVRVTLDAEKQSTIIKVQDQGKGINKGELEKIFHPFYRTSDAKNDKNKKGSGLGLAIAKLAIKKNSGNIEAYNLDEGGLCIQISLPLA